MRVISIFCLVGLLLMAGMAMGQVLPPDPGEFGDAPEGALAYPSLGVNGLFPTSRGGPAGAVYHANQIPMAWFGPTMDIELDGNAGLAVSPPYEMDECWGAADGDGGLINTSTFTIFQNQVTQCSSGPIDPVGAACTTVSWGAAIDIAVENYSFNDALINVLIDWNQDGEWGYYIDCNGVQRSEHVVQNLPLQHGFAGLLSGLNPGQLHIGPNPGYVWARFTIGDPIPVPIGWDGSFMFDTGETEDYLLYIGNGSVGQIGELGDAPEEVTAYPDGTMGHFPTCVATGPAGHIFHGPIIDSYFGQSVDLESEGNHDMCSFTPYENDECHYLDGDGGLLMPASYTLVGGSAMQCGTAGPLALGDPCQQADWGRNIDIEIHNNSSSDLFFNVLADWSHNGRWGEFVTCNPLVSGPEHFVPNVVVPAGFSGTASMLGLPAFPIMSDIGYVWFRFTLSDSPVPASTDDVWTGEGQFGNGETEDYLLFVGETTDVPSMGSKLELLPSQPNPFNPSTTISFVHPRSGMVRVTIHDVSGRLVRTLVDGRFDQGTHRTEWNGLDDNGRRQNSGVYFVRVASGREVSTGKLMMIK